MKSKCLFRIPEVMMLITLIFGAMSCAMGEFSPARLDKIHEEDKKWGDWLDKYIKSVLYVGMPENEFVNLFTKNTSWNDAENAERPYILSHQGNKYIIVGLKGIKYRLTFINGSLESLEEYGWEKIPVLTSSYRDVTQFLKGYKSEGPGFYDGMPEDEFLRIFSDSVLSHAKDSYVVIGKNGRKYRLIFKNGYLIGLEGGGFLK